MTKFNVPIPEYKGYTIHLITHEITNGKGRIMKTRLDSRGRFLVGLVHNTGKQRTVVVKDLVRKLAELVEIRTEKDAILTKTLFSYYTNLDQNTAKCTAREWADIISKDVPEAEILEIGRIVNKLITCRTL